MNVNNLSRIIPSSVIPKVVIPQFQNADFSKYFGAKTSYGTAGSDFLYLNTINKVSATTEIGQQWRIPESVQASNGQLQFPYYTISARSEYSDQSAQKFSELGMGISLPDLLDKLCEMGIQQRRHYAALFGFNPLENQGLLNMATAVTLPADSGTHTTLSTYIQGELLSFLVSVARDIMNGTFGMAKPVVLASSVRTINLLESIIVPLTDWQNKGAGVNSVAGTYRTILGEWLGAGKIEFIKDDLLKEAGTGLSDIILLIAPGLSEQEAVEYDQNLDISQETANTLIDNPGDMIITTNPKNNRMMSSDYSVKTTPGCVVREEAIVAITAKYA